MLLSPPVDVGGGVPPCAVSRLPSGGMVLSWCYRDTIVLLACYRSGTGMARQERSLMASSMPGAKHQRGHSLTVGSAASFGADIFFHREILAPVRRLQSRPESRHRRGSMSVDGSRRGVPLKMGNFVRVLSNFAPKAVPVGAPGSYFVSPEGVPLGHSAPSPIPGRTRPTGRPYQLVNSTPPQQCSRRGKP